MRRRSLAPEVTGLEARVVLTVFVEPPEGFNQNSNVMSFDGSINSEMVGSFTAESVNGVNVIQDEDLYNLNLTSPFSGDVQVKLHINGLPPANAVDPALGAVGEIYLVGDAGGGFFSNALANFDLNSSSSDVYIDMPTNYWLTGEEGEIDALGVQLIVGGFYTQPVTPPTYNVVINGGPDTTPPPPPPPLPDIAMGPESISANGQNINASYSITGNDLPGPSTVGFYWATGTTFADRIGTSPVTVETATATSSPSPYNASIPLTRLGTRPANATYILAVADSPDLAPDSNPNGLILESNENNNTASVSIPKPTPHIEITNKPTDGIFFITADAKMPTINATLVGVTPDPGTKLTWTMEVDYVAANFPPNSASGPGEDMFIKYPSETTDGTQYTPSFHDEDGDSMFSGGDVTISVEAIVNGHTVNISTNPEDDGVIAIEGMNPTPQAVKDFVAKNLPQPANWPAKTQYDFHTIIDKIISKESSFAQFYNGEPHWSLDGLHGAGMMQVTHPSPTTDDIWNWKINILDGANIFEQKLSSAYNYASNYEKYHLSPKAAAALNTEIKALRIKDGLNTLTLAPLKPDQLVRQAIRAFNGGYEFDPATNSKGVLLVTQTSPGMGVINWVENYNGGYVNAVLSQKV